MPAELLTTAFDPARPQPAHLAQAPHRRGGGRGSDDGPQVVEYLTVVDHLPAVDPRLLPGDGDTAAGLAEVEELVAAYERVFTAIEAKAPVIRLDTPKAQPGPG